MKLKKGFIVHNKKGEALLVPTAEAAFSGIVQGNKTLGLLLNLLQEETTAEKMIASMKEHFEAPDGAIERDVNKVIAELRKIGALDE